MPKLYGLGAAVVILGALFKIQHYPGASIMLIAGLGTEAVLFVMFAFAPKEAHVATFDEWARVYPQLKDASIDLGDDAPTQENVAGSLSEMMSGANINQNVIDGLGKGLKGLTDSVSKMGDLSNAAVATDEYAKTVKVASKSLESVSKSYATTAEAMSGMANAATDAKEYHSQVQSITKNLGSLNAVYEMELQDANNHLKAMNKFYANLSSAMENMADASKDTNQFKTELSGLTKNLTSLNTVYGSMLTAMKG
jgi:gliding motility-associated protein GldL